MNPYQAPNTKVGFRSILQQIAREQAVSYPEIAERTGVHFTTIYNILKEQKGDEKKSVRLSTMRQIVEGLGYKITMSPDGLELIVSSGPLGQDRREKNTLVSFANEIIDVLRSQGVNKISNVEKEKIKDVVRVMVRK